MDAAHSHELGPTGFESALALARELVWSARLAVRVCADTALADMHGA